MASHPSAAAAQANLDRAQLEQRRARLEPYPDVKVGLAGGRIGETDQSIIQLGFSLPLPLIDRGKELGLQPDWFGEQYRFLLSAGIVEEIEEIERSEISDEQKLKLRLALKKLIMPEGGMGDTFRILIQSRGIEPVRLLCQRRIGG